MYSLLFVSCICVITFMALHAKEAERQSRHIKNIARAVRYLANGKKIEGIVLPPTRNITANITTNLDVVGVARSRPPVYFDLQNAAKTETEE